MKGYRNIYRCPKCKKVAKDKEHLTNDSSLFMLAFNGPVLCKHCGMIIKLERISAKPKLFGLLGWDIKGEE